MAIVGTLGYNFQAVLPLLARFTFDGGASTYAVLVAAMGLGAIVGALINGARGSVTPTLLVGAALVFGVLSLLAAGAPDARARGRRARAARARPRSRWRRASTPRCSSPRSRACAAG